MIIRYYLFKFNLNSFHVYSLKFGIMSPAFKAHSAMLKYFQHYQNLNWLRLTIEAKWKSQRKFHQSLQLLQSAPKLTPQEVSAILRANEYSR